MNVLHGRVLRRESQRYGSLTIPGDRIPLRHGNGNNLSFTDGHVKYLLLSTDQTYENIQARNLQNAFSINGKPNTPLPITGVSGTGICAE